MKDIRQEMEDVMDLTKQIKVMAGEVEMIAMLFDAKRGTAVIPLAIAPTKEQAQFALRVLIKIAQPDRVLVVIEAFMKQVQPENIEEFKKNYVPGNLNKDPDATEAIVIISYDHGFTSCLTQPFTMVDGRPRYQEQTYSENIESAFFPEPELTGKENFQ